MFLYMLLITPSIQSTIIKISQNEKTNDIISAAADIANSNFEHRRQTIVITSDVDEGVTSTFLQQYRGSVVVEAKMENIPRQVVLLIQSYYSFVKLSGILKPDLKGKSILHSGAKFLIVLFSYPSRLEQIYSLLWDFYATNVVIIVKTSGKVALYTYYPYKNPSDCANVAPTFIGTWTKITTGSQELYPDKMSNMNGCPLYISTTKVYHPATEKKIPLQIIKRSIHELLKNIMNFTSVIINRRYISIDSDSATNWSESLSDVITGTANISTSTVALGFDKVSLLDFSVTYFRIRLAWIAPPPSVRPALWKLLVPLNGYLWLILLVVTFFVKSVPYALRAKHVRAFSFRNFKGFGKLQGITMRTWGVLMGQPVKVSPRRFRDFYIIGLWLWFTFFIRSAYQSVLIGALKTDTTLGTFTNLQEAVDDGFSYGGRLGVLGYFEHDPLVRNGFQVISESEYEQTFRDILNSKKKFIMATSLEYAWTLCSAEAITEEECGYVLPDSILVVPLVVWMQKSSSFVKPLSVWLPRLIESGLLEKDSLQKPLKDVKMPDQSPLTNKQAISCFLFLLIGYFLSIVVFACELFNKRSSSFRKFYQIVISGQSN
ncbi:unnamed protein product [Leptosia nina]|uniref:Putative ionotropic receptor ligand binding domain-containing protein n=1 Tax=Leptosia nina TaxID=320188 RepID=A0AAV1JUC4_9NEOP